jgi:hypothetical protein
MSDIDLSHIRDLRGKKELPCYLRYQGQTQPQPAFVELAEDGEVRASANPEIGNAVPSYVYHGRSIRWKIDPALRGEQIADAVERLAPLLEAIHQGHTVEWDGNNMTGRLTEEASAASDELERELENVESDVNVWEVEDWLWSNQTLLDVWPEGKTLESAAQDAMPTDPGVFIAGDLEDLKKAIVEDSIYLLEHDLPGLTRWHLDVLLEEQVLDPEMAEEYAARHIAPKRAVV